jgi:hypothetical protein
MSTLKTRLTAAFEELKRLIVSVSDYDGAARDVAFDLASADGAVAGIATTILDGQSVPHEHRPVVRQPFLRADGWWLPSDGPPVDLRPYPELLRYATVIEQVRKLCAEHLRGG